MGLQCTEPAFGMEPLWCGEPFGLEALHCGVSLDARGEGGFVVCVGFLCVVFLCVGFFVCGFFFVQGRFGARALPICLISSMKCPFRIMFDYKMFQIEQYIVLFLGM